MAFSFCHASCTVCGNNIMITMMDCCVRSLSTFWSLSGPSWKYGTIGDESTFEWWWDETKDFMDLFFESFFRSMMSWWRLSCPPFSQEGSGKEWTTGKTLRQIFKPNRCRFSSMSRKQPSSRKCIYRHFDFREREKASSPSTRLFLYALPRTWKKLLERGKMSSFRCVVSFRFVEGTFVFVLRFKRGEKEAVKRAWLTGLGLGTNEAKEREREGVKKS